MSIYTDSIADDMEYSVSDWMRSEGYDEPYEEDDDDGQTD